MQNRKNHRKTANTIDGFRLRLILPALVCLLIIAGCAGSTASSPPLAAHKKSPATVAGYLKPADLPDSRILLRPPPLPGSAAFTADQAAYRLTRSLRNSTRWELAAKDAELTFPNVAETFSCALGISVTEEAMPILFTLMHRSGISACEATDRAKVYYQRIRPFVMNRETTCNRMTRRTSVKTAPTRPAIQRPAGHGP